MHRHPALRPLSRGHQPLLVHARDLRWRAAYLERGDAHLGTEAWPTFRAWAQHALSAHLAAEETHLLPRLRAVPGDEVAAALSDDQQARAALRDLTSTLPDDERHADLRRIAEALRAHAHVCERVLFPLAERVLDDDELEAVRRGVGVYEV